MISSHQKTVYQALGRNPIHPFPARMAPDIALNALSSSLRKLRVLDPMMGSGTVLAVAKSLGHRALGTDTDPLAVLLSKVWTTSIEQEKVFIMAECALKDARLASPSIAPQNAYPPNADIETKVFLNYWFDAFARRELAAISNSIRKIQDRDIRDVLWCAMSRLIITKDSGVSLARDLSHSRPHKAFVRAPIKPFDKFLSAVEVVVKNCPRKGAAHVGPRTSTLEADARALPIANRSIDLVITSPPYLNAIDYLRCSKFSLVWMGYPLNSLRKVRRETVGTARGFKREMVDKQVETVIDALCLTPALNPTDTGLLRRYVADMQKSLAEVARVLVPGGRAVYVVGNSTIRGTFVRNSRIVQIIAKREGFTLVQKRTRLLPPNRRYMPPRSSASAGTSFSTRIREEVVLVFERSKAD